MARMPNNIHNIYILQIYIHVCIYICCCSLAKLCLTLWDPMDTRLLCPPLSPRVYTNSCPLSRWCYLTILSSAASSFYMRTYSFIHAYTYIITDFVCTFSPFLSFLVFLLILSFKKSLFLRRYIMQLTFPEIFYWALENIYVIYIIWHSCNISGWKYFCNNIILLF